MATLFISDLHLHASRPEATQVFYQFLQERAQGAEALYILGDFFDAWIGDDDDDPLVDEVAEQLAKLARTGTAIYLMHGNRDFLLGETFAQRAGARLLPDPSLIDLYGRPALLLHGDSLCTRDTEYMALRSQLRSEQWQAQILAQPLAVRRALAAELRAKSKTMNSSKAEDIMDVTPAAVTELMREQGVDLMIHGHTHRPHRHQLDIDHTPAERIVLGDWHDNAWCLVATPESLELEHWAI
ncbi:UDP-2,3-diacylglucosamine diphosphatase [Gilvimarinus xylanilyticus]|uniref:UDP-2,3-diacylglucosamine hydrolase n=1 Tax=Gilvimarinus xylanilyticus TaxID=2944139 RepID=A0A9X2HT46_9GAMM|nr:UDP-2,3-diacylglucosamine diphosphatase [Gilvimarinus xylanilyticus]MCP8898053.1 UDP-2,3-diacylglucosamine diphosphatase [Gilvimarinus xylanilyticus]